jgi:hypothetical protein
VEATKQKKKRGRKKKPKPEKPEGIMPPPISDSVQRGSVWISVEQARTRDIIVVKWRAISFKSVLRSYTSL